MNSGLQRQIAIKSGISDTFISMILAGKRRPSWQVSKRLAAVTHTEPTLWVDGTPAQIKKALSRLKLEIKAR